MDSPLVTLLIEFGCLVAVSFQNIFRLEMYQNNVFFLKKLFLILSHQNDLKIPKKILI
jgi:hypothetical protein